MYFTYLISSGTIGHQDPELGKPLMHSFFLNHPLQKINSGISLARTGSSKKETQILFAAVHVSSPTARIYSTAENTKIFYTLGITEHTTGKDLYLVRFA